VNVTEDRDDLGKDNARFASRRCVPGRHRWRCVPQDLCRSGTQRGKAVAAVQVVTSAGQVLATADI
jgi:hypothetical protein